LELRKYYFLPLIDSIRDKGVVTNDFYVDGHGVVGQVYNTQWIGGFKRGISEARQSMMIDRPTFIVLIIGRVDRAQKGFLSWKIHFFSWCK